MVGAGLAFANERAAVTILGLKAVVHKLLKGCPSSRCQIVQYAVIGDEQFFAAGTPDSTAFNVSRLTSKDDTNKYNEDNVMLPESPDNGTEGVQDEINTQIHTVQPLQ